MRRVFAIDVEAGALEWPPSVPAGKNSPPTLIGGGVTMTMIEPLASGA